LVEALVLNVSDLIGAAADAVAAIVVVGELIELDILELLLGQRRFTGQNCCTNGGRGRYHHRSNLRNMRV